ncbi:uncharacterized protein LOC135497401 [Lineus longissimus]|uniref:uncharacterized protein LOC135497401 n=1 Tax=Lineus longissimus TaxID=88925 RepID=UPI002B4EB62A
MSHYADYNVHIKKQKFDEIRRPVGAKHIIRALHTELRKPIGDTVVLDAGCGTGSYSVELAKAGVKKLTLLDANSEMLKKAEEKFREHHECELTFKQCQLPTIPFENDAFDCVMMNMVLHHLDFYDYEKLLADDVRPKSRPKQVEAMKEAWRVLRSGGLLAMTISFPHQVLKGGWYYGLAHIAQKRAAIRSTDYDEYRSYLGEAGFEDFETIVPLDTTFLAPEHYFNLEGPLNKDWRERDAILFSCPDSVNLDEIVAMREAGTLEKYFKEKDKGRKEVGQFAVLIAKK